MTVSINKEVAALLSKYTQQDRIEVLEAVVNYAKDGTIPKTLNLLIETAFLLIKSTCETNEKKTAINYELSEKRRAAGRKGMAARYGKSTKSNDESDEFVITKPNKNCNKNDNKNLTKSNKIIAKPENAAQNEQDSLARDSIINNNIYNTSDPSLRSGSVSFSPENDALSQSAEKDDISIPPRTKKEKESSAKEKEAIAEVVRLYHEICKDYPRIAKISDIRRTKILCRLREMPNGIADFEAVFRKMQESQFLKGDNRNGWKATLDWVISNSTNWIKIIEGNYDNKQSNARRNIGTESRGAYGVAGRIKPADEYEDDTTF